MAGELIAGNETSDWAGLGVAASPRASAASPRPQTRCTARCPRLQLLRVRHFDWTHLTLPLRPLPPSLTGLRIVHLTDLHLRRSWEPAYTTLHEELAADPPHLVLLTGDMVDDKYDHRPAMPMVERFIAGLKSRCGIYSILGNHDSLDLGAEMHRLGVQMICGQQRIVQFEDAEVELIGLPGYLRDHLPSDFATRFSPPREDRARIVLGHYPDHLPPTRGLAADIYLAGHTHGGQVCLPDGRAVFSHDSLPLKQARGVHRYGQTWLVVNRGLGFSGPRARLFCPPEAIEIRLWPQGA